MTKTDKGWLSCAERLQKRFLLLSFFTCSLTTTTATEAETGQLSGFVLLKHLKPNFPHRTLSLSLLYLCSIVRICLTDDSLTQAPGEGRHHLSEVTNHLGHWHKNMEFELTKTSSSTDMIMLISCSCFSN